MSTDGILRFQNTKKATFVGPTSNISFDTVNSSLGIGVTGDDVPSSNLYITGNAYVSSDLALGGVLTMGTVNVVARHSLQAVTEIGNTTSLTTEFTNPTTSLVASGNVEINGQTTISGHIIPSVNNAYDIGSAENKIRDLYVDNNSLWVGDRAKISFSRGRMMFKHRKLNHVPRVVLQLALNDGRQNEAAVEQEAIAFAQTVDPTVSSLEDVRLEHWRDFTKTIDETKEVSDIFADNEEDYEAMTAADAFKEVGSNIFTTHGVTIGGDTDPRAILDIKDTGAVIVPVGTTAERPPTAVNGMFRYNSETGYFEAYTVSGWGFLATPPSIESFTPTVVETNTSSGTQITVTGSFFDQNSSIKLRGSDETLYSTTSFSFTSPTSISATLPFLPSTKSPYKVVVTAGSNLSKESTDTLTSNNNTPVWISPEQGVTVFVFRNASTTITLEATDDPVDTLTYSIVSGTLPEGLSFDGNTISGASTAAVNSASTITVRASDGDLYADRTFTIATGSTEGEAVFTTATTHAWTVPPGVFSVSVVAIGGGGGSHTGYTNLSYNGANGAGGGGLVWGNNIPVTPGQTYTVQVGAGGFSRNNEVGTAGRGGDSYFIDSSTLLASGGDAATYTTATTSNLPIANGGGYSGTYAGGGGVGGGGGRVTVDNTGGGGGGGAGGYSGNGGQGGDVSSTTTAINGVAGAGGGGGGGGSSYNPTYGGSAGGGVGLYGQGSDGTGANSGSAATGGGGGGGSGGSSGAIWGNSGLGTGGNYGGGGAGGGDTAGGVTYSAPATGGQGAVRIIWGENRAFPSTNVGESQSYGNVSTY